MTGHTKSSEYGYLRNKILEKYLGIKFLSTGNWQNEDDKGEKEITGEGQISTLGSDRVVDHAYYQ